MTGSVWWLVGGGVWGMFWLIYGTNRLYQVDQPKETAMKQSSAGGHCWDQLDGDVCAEATTENATLKARNAEMDLMLAEAADYLNSHSGMDGMDIGAKITAYRLAQQKTVRAALSSVEVGK